MNPRSPAHGSQSSPGKPKLLIIELWGLGDLAIATPFLRVASKEFEVTLLAKPFASELQTHFWPDIKVIPFSAPWTAFKNKYSLWHWPVSHILQLRRTLAAARFDFGLSSRWDPRDHFLLQMTGARQRLGFPRLKSELFLTNPLVRPEPLAHHYEFWRVAAESLNLELPPRKNLIFPRRKPPGNHVLVHSGARVAVRVWPLEQYAELVRRLRQDGYPVKVACDHDQLDWWKKSGEPDAASPGSVDELMMVLDQSKIFIGNDSGPGHLAAIAGLPTFTIFGPQLPEWFAPLHPQSAWIEGKSCPYKPCSDYCRFTTPECLWGITVDEVWLRVKAFAGRPVSPTSGPGMN